MRLPSVITMASTSLAGQFHTMAAWNTYPRLRCIRSDAFHVSFRSHRLSPVRRTAFTDEGVNLKGGAHHLPLVSCIKVHASRPPVQLVVVLHEHDDRHVSAPHSTTLENLRPFILTNIVMGVGTLSHGTFSHQFEGSGHGGLHQAGPADCWSVDNGRHLWKVVQQDPVKEGLVAILHQM